MIADGSYCCWSKSCSVKEDIGPQGPVRDGREGQKHNETCIRTPQKNFVVLNVISHAVIFRCTDKSNKAIVISQQGTKAENVMKVNESCQKKNNL